MRRRRSRSGTLQKGTHKECSCNSFHYNLLSGMYIKAKQEGSVKMVEGSERVSVLVVPFYCFNCNLNSNVCKFSFFYRYDSTKKSALRFSPTLGLWNKFKFFIFFPFTFFYFFSLTPLHSANEQLSNTIIRLAR